MKKIICLFVCLFVSSANAGIIYDGGSPDLVNGYEATSWVEAEDFTLNQNATVTGAQFWTLESGSSWDGTLDWFIFSDVAGAPSSSPLFSGTGVNISKTDTGRDAFGFNEFSYVFDFGTSINLTVSTDYWFGLHLSSDFVLDSIYWETGDLTSNSAGMYSYGGTFDNWSSNGQYLAFNLRDNATVPEPTSIALLGLGLAGLAFSRKKKSA